MGFWINLEKILLATYGCGLDYYVINNLVKDKLSAFEIERYGIPEEDIPKTLDCDDGRKILFRYEAYDVNRENNRKLEDFYFHLYHISEEQLKDFEDSLSISVKGKHIRCPINARGHIEVEINHIEFSARSLVTIDRKTIVYLIDEEAEGNALIRSQLQLLPPELHSLELDYGISYEKRKLEVRDWIQKIYNLVNLWLSMF